MQLLEIKLRNVNIIIILKNWFAVPLTYIDRANQRLEIQRKPRNRDE